MGHFDNILLVSDFDGTLIGPDGLISQQNIRAINDFVDAGGHFAGATGRTESNVQPYLAGLPLVTPWILYNGAAIYDLKKDAFSYRGPLDQASIRSFIVQVMTCLPEINVQIFPGGPFWQVNPQALPDKVVVRENQQFIDASIEEVPEPWLKVLFCSDDPDQIRAVEVMFDQSSLVGTVHKTRSGRRYFELMAQGVNKGAALAQLKAMLGFKPRCVVAIGDYRNDIEMLIAADVAAAPESALPEVKALAKIITRCHSEHALADLLQQLPAYLG